MSQPYVSLVIPTKGRDTLKRCLESVTVALQGVSRELFDVTVVKDSYEMDDETHKNIEELCDKYKAWVLEFDAKYHDWGYPQLEFFYLNRARSTYIWNIGDDDTVPPNTFTRILDILKANGTNHPYMFQAALFSSPHRGIPAGEYRIVWDDSDRSITRQKITGQNLLCLNDKYTMGHWVDDFEFMRQTLEQYNHVQWVPVVIAECY